MKKRAVVVLALTFVLALFAVAASAHPPKNLSASWDAAGKKLTVTAEHSVNDASKHFVLGLTIFEGNKQILQKQYTSQSSAGGFSDSFVLQRMPSGTKIRIQVVCNIMGSAEMEYVIP